MRNLQRSSEGQKKEKGCSSAALIAGAQNKAVADDGTAAPTAIEQVAFPSSTYKSDVPMPSRDNTLVKKKVLYLYNDGKGGGLKWTPFTVKSATRPSRAGAESSELAAPQWRFTLQIGKKGDSIETKLPKKHYGTKWLLAEKVK